MTSLVSSVFEKHGRFVARHPLPFIILPVLVSILLAVGLINIETKDDAEYLYTPRDAQSKNERKVLEKSFPLDDTNMFIASRKLSLDGFLQVIFKARGGENILTEQAMDEVIKVDRVIRERLVEVEGVQVNYTDICSMWEGRCVGNDVLSWIKYNVSGIESLNMTYPRFAGTFLGGILGGVETNTADQVKTAETMLFTYFVRDTTSDDVSKAEAWGEELVDFLLNYDMSTLKHMTFTHRSFLSLDQEIAKAADNVLPLFALTYAIIVTFSVCVTLMMDWVRAKPWVALGGVVAACLAILSSLGLMAGAGVPFAMTVATMPFLIIGKYTCKFKIFIVTSHACIFFLTI